jgi:hypothetical protein
MQYAADKNLTVINGDRVRAAGESKTLVAAPDFTEGIDGAV